MLIARLKLQEWRSKLQLNVSHESVMQLVSRGNDIRDQQRAHQCFRCAPANNPINLKLLKEHRCQVRSASCTRTFFFVEILPFSTNFH